MAWCAHCENSSVPEVGDVCTGCKDAERESMEDALGEYKKPKPVDEDPLCMCGDTSSQHVDGCEQCVIPGCGCREFQSREEE